VVKHKIWLKIGIIEIKMCTLSGALISKNKDIILWGDHYCAGQSQKKEVLSSLLNKMFQIIAPFSILTLSSPIITKEPYANSLDPDEMPSYLASHPDPSCLTLRQYLHSS